MFAVTQIALGLCKAFCQDHACSQALSALYHVTALAAEY